MNHAVNWEAISAIGQIVGAIALVISLIYVASEVRRNTRATHLAAIRSMHDAFNRWIQQIAEHPHLTKVYNRGIHDFESLEGTDLIRFLVSCTGRSEILRRYITSKRRAIWKKTCDLGGKWSWETSMHIPEFRLGGIYAR